MAASNSDGADAPPPPPRLRAVLGRSNAPNVASSESSRKPSVPARAEAAAAAQTAATAAADDSAPASPRPLSPSPPARASAASTPLRSSPNLLPSPGATPPTRARAARPTPSSRSPRAFEVSPRASLSYARGWEASSPALASPVAPIGVASPASPAGSPPSSPRRYESRRPAPLTPVGRPDLTFTLTPVSTPSKAGDNCCICLEPLDAAEAPVHTLGKCGHTFHLDCIRLARARSHSACPLCRSEISPGLTPSHDRFNFGAHRGFSPLDHSTDIRTASARARAAVALRLAAIEERALPTLGGQPQRFTLTDDDDF